MSDAAPINCPGADFICMHCSEQSNISFADIGELLEDRSISCKSCNTTLQLNQEEKHQLQKRLNREATKGKALLCFGALFFPTSLVVGLLYGKVGGLAFLAGIAVMALINSSFRQAPETYRLEVSSVSPCKD